MPCVTNAFRENTAQFINSLPTDSSLSYIVVYLILLLSDAYKNITLQWKFLGNLKSKQHEANFLKFNICHTILVLISEQLFLDFPLNGL